MEELETNEELNINVVSENTTIPESTDNSEKTDIVEYKEVEEPCVALTIIGENKLTDAEVFIRRGIRYSIKAFFSAIALTIMNLFIQLIRKEIFLCLQ